MYSGEPFGAGSFPVQDTDIKIAMSTSTIIINDFIIFLIN
jgi:hypothetical protein